MNVIDDYLNKNATPSQRAVLRKIRAYIKELVPDVQEVISYGIPTFKHKGKYIIYFGAFKSHMSLYPITSPGIREKLKDFKTSKGTVQFTELKVVPDSIIKEMVEARLKAIEAGNNDY